MEQRLRSEVLRLLGTRLITRFADGVRRCQRLEADVRHRLAALCETVPIPSDVDVALIYDSFTITLAEGETRTQDLKVGG